jgi:hypothetical protein
VIPSQCRWSLKRLIEFDDAFDIVVCVRALVEDNARLRAALELALGARSDTDPNV